MKSRLFRWTISPMLFFYFSILPAQEKNNENELVLGQILKIVRNIKVEEVQSFKRKISVDNFDFLQFKPISGVKSSNYFDVFFQNNDIVKISKISNSSEDNFDFFITKNSELNFQIILINEFTDSKHTIDKTFINGFILRYRNECYFFGRSHFGGKTFFNSSAKISAFMKLNSSLRPISMLRFSNGSLEYYSNVNYNAKNYILSESIFVPMKGTSINDNTSLVSLVSLFQKAEYKFKEKKKIGLVEELAYLPLWIYEGNHIHR